MSMDEQDKGTEQADLGRFKDCFHIVLVESIDSLNIGSVARAMMNLGFYNLHLVSPQEFDRTKAARTACHAVGILDRAAIHQTLAEALSSMQDVVGFSARAGKNRAERMLLSEWAALKVENKPKKTALLFGPEDTGLRTEHLEQCRLLIHIPASSDNPSFNLSQAVLLALYELSRSSWRTEDFIAGREPASWNDYYQMDRIVHELGEQSDFFRQGTPAHIPGLVKNIFRRIKTDQREMRVLLGFLGRVNRTLKRLGGSPSH